MCLNGDLVIVHPHCPSHHIRVFTINKFLWHFDYKMPPKPSHNHNFTSGLNYYSRQYLVSQMNTTNKNFRIAHNNSSPPSL